MWRINTHLVRKKAHKIKLLWLELLQWVDETKRKLCIKKEWINKVEANKILFSNFGVKGYGGNPKYIAEELIRSGKDYKLVWMVDDKEKYHDFPCQIKVVNLYSKEFYHEIATSHIWIDNVRKPQYMIKRKNQFYIQLWHGAFPFKKIEWDAEGDLSKRYLSCAKYDSKIIDLFVSGNSYFSNLIKNAFKYEGDILECGNPCNDLFFQENNDLVRKVFEYLKCNEEKRIVLYAPTFRNTIDANGYKKIDAHMVCNVLKEKYGQEYIFVYRLHPNVKCNLELEKNEYDATNYEDMQELLSVADILITDYSSIMIDFSLMHKPVFLYQDDRISYMQERDLYFDDFPFPTAKNNNELVELLTRYDTSDENKINEFMSKYQFFDCGNASQSIIKIIDDIIANK